MSPMRASAVLLALLSLGACKKDAAPVAPMPASAVNPMPSAAPGSLTGRVAERLDAPNYTYLRITNAQGDTWAAVPTTTVAVGAEVTVTNPMPMRNFESKTLGRTFELVMFGAGAQPVGEAAAQPANPHAAEAPRPAAAPVDLADIKVPKAAGADAKLVAEVFAQRVELKDKMASVRGKVVKVTTGVMGKNWLHLRDGSGSDAAQDNDLIITTNDVVQVNDVVTAQGKVTIDKDLGSGYSYKVLIEDAKVAP